MSRQIAIKRLLNKNFPGSMKGSPEGARKLLEEQPKPTGLSGYFSRLTGARKNQLQSALDEAGDYSYLVDSPRYRNSLGHSPKQLYGQALKEETRAARNTRLKTFIPLSITGGGYSYIKSQEKTAKFNRTAALFNSAAGKTKKVFGKLFGGNTQTAAEATIQKSKKVTQKAKKGLSDKTKINVSAYDQEIDKGIRQQTEFAAKQYGQEGVDRVLAAQINPNSKANKAAKKLVQDATDSPGYFAARKRKKLFAEGINSPDISSENLKAMRGAQLKDKNKIFKGNALAVGGVAGTSIIGAAALDKRQREQRRQLVYQNFHARTQR